MMCIYKCSWCCMSGNYIGLYFIHFNFKVMHFECVRLVYCMPIQHTVYFLFVLFPCMHNSVWSSLWIFIPLRPVLSSPSPSPLSWDSTAFSATWALTSPTVPLLSARSCYLLMVHGRHSIEGRLQHSSLFY